VAVSVPSAALAYADDVARTPSSSRAWRKFARNPAALLGVLILLVVAGYGRERGLGLVEPPGLDVGIGQRERVPLELRPAPLLGAQDRDRLVALAPPQQHLG
jgi:hypothetical protein